MNIKRIALSIFLPLLILAGIPYGCSETPDRPLSEIIVGEDAVSVGAKGGIRLINYEVKGTGSEQTVEPATKAEWIHSFDLSVPGKLFFTVDPNAETESREADIILYCMDRQVSRTICVRQDAAQESGEWFELDIKSFTECTAIVSIIPKNPDMSYLVMVVEKSFRDRFDSEEDMCEAMKAELQTNAEAAGLTLPQFLSKVLMKGEQELQLTGLNPDTEYDVFAVGMDYDGTLLSGLDEQFFKTEELEMQDVTFDIQYRIEGPFVEMTVEPSVQETAYFFNAMEKSQYDALGGDIAGPLQEALREEIALGVEAGLTVEQAVYQLTSYGKSSLPMDMNANTEYIGYAFGWTESGTINTEIAVKEFTTGDIPPSDNRLEAEILSVNVNFAEVHIHTTNTDPYVLTTVEAEKWQSLSDEEVLAEFTSGKYDLTANTFSGDFKGRITHLSGDTEYLVFVFGYRAGKATTGLVRNSFRTLSSGMSGEMEFSFEISDITPEGATVRVTPDPMNALYFWDTTSASMDEEEIEQMINETVEHYIGLGYVKDRADYMRQAGTYGTDIYVYDNFYSNADYRPYAFGVDENTGERTTDMIFGDTFTTAPPEYSDIIMTLVHDEYYDGAEVAALYPEFSPAAGSAILPVSVKIVNGSAHTYYYNVYRGDLTDEKEYPDKRITDVLIPYGIQDEEKHDFILRYDEEMTMVGVAMDSNGKFSRMYRYKFTLNRDGVSDASGFSPAGTAAAGASRIAPGGQTVRGTEFRNTDTVSLPGGVRKTETAGSGIQTPGPEVKPRNEWIRREWILLVP